MITNSLLDEIHALKLKNAELVKMLRECADYLNEVRTGEDFESECWRVAEKATELCDSQ